MRGPWPRVQATSPDGQHRFLFVSNTTADWWLAVEKGMKDGGQDAGCQVEMRFNDGTVQGQVNKLREGAVAAGSRGRGGLGARRRCAGIIDAMKELQKAGKYVIAIDSDVAPQFADAQAGLHRHGQSEGRADPG